MRMFLHRGGAAGGKAFVFEDFADDGGAERRFCSFNASLISYTE
jgi:hypothetical protein